MNTGIGTPVIPAGVSVPVPGPADLRIDGRLHATWRNESNEFDSFQICVCKMSRHLIGEVLPGVDNRVSIPGTPELWDGVKASGYGQYLFYVRGIKGNTESEWSNTVFEYKPKKVGVPPPATATVPRVTVSRKILAFVAEYWLLMLVPLFFLGVWIFLPEKKAVNDSQVRVTSALYEADTGGTNFNHLRSTIAALQEQKLLTSELQRQISELRQASTNTLSAVASTTHGAPTATTNIVITASVEALKVVPTNLPTPPPNGVAMGIGIVQGNLNLNIGPDGTVTMGSDSEKKMTLKRRYPGMPEKPAYVTDILDETRIQPVAGTEIKKFMTVPPGDGVQFNLPSGWTVVTGVYKESQGGVKVFAYRDAFIHLVNVGTVDRPEWVETDYAEQRQTSVKAHSFWIRSTTGRPLDVMFILTPTPTAK